MVNRTENDGASETKPIPPSPSSSAPPPLPPPPPPPQSGTKRPLTPKSKEKEKMSICPICNKNLCHEKALNGHIRWHTAEERAKTFAATVTVEEQEPKRFKVPDLNRSPPPEDGDW
ncbi:putative transcription factor C2H2 family [Helianthus annuus]|nr:putative transcription factor C2H2 family [Helianthus annuus]